MKHMRWLLCVVVGCVALVGCGPSQAPQQTPAAVDMAGVDSGPVDGDWLINRLPAEMEHLNPLTATDAYASTIISLVFDSLLDRNPETLEMEPHVAERWEISEDHLVYTFHLRQGVVFSDGTPLTANDVKFTYDKLMDPATDAPHLRNYYQEVESCELLDDYTVRFTCSKPYYRHIVMIGGLEIVPRHIYGEGDFNNHPRNRAPVGSGPYTIEEWITGQQVVLARNPHYWGKVVNKWPYVDKRIYKIITDDTVAFQVLNRGDLDSMAVLPEDWVRRANTKQFESQFGKYEYFAPAVLVYRLEPAAAAVRRQTRAAGLDHAAGSRNDLPRDLPRPGADHDGQLHARYAVPQRGVTALAF